VTKVNASFQKLTQREFRERHGSILSGLLILGSAIKGMRPTGGPLGMYVPTAQALPVK
jgi:hypothetical protein|tara:strand:+ start:491 stop:664 length:174 start_codon:yes stop_codon:yes gene_type:complete